jgi:hypothetical protein
VNAGAVRCLRPNVLCVEGAQDIRSRSVQPGIDDLFAASSHDPIDPAHQTSDDISRRLRRSAGILTRTTDNLTGVVRLQSFRDFARLQWRWGVTGDARSKRQGRVLILHGLLCEESRLRTVQSHRTSR